VPNATAHHLAPAPVALPIAPLPPPGLAEYLDLLYALHELFPGQTSAQQQWLGRLSAYGYLKQGVVAGQSALSQTRPPIDGLAEPPAERG